MVTALENQIDGSPSIPINGSTAAFPVPLALATLSVGPAITGAPKSSPDL
jgi:hypothetical protein